MHWPEKKFRDKVYTSTTIDFDYVLSSQFCSRLMLIWPTECYPEQFAMHPLRLKLTFNLYFPYISSLTQIGSISSSDELSLIPFNTSELPLTLFPNDNGNNSVRLSRYFRRKNKITWINCVCTFFSVSLFRLSYFCAKKWLNYLNVCANVHKYWPVSSVTCMFVQSKIQDTKRSLFYVRQQPKVRNLIQLLYLNLIWTE